MTAPKLKLKRCPFCGKPPVMRGPDPWGEGYIECMTKECSPMVVRTMNFKLENAVNVWNRRADGGNNA